MAINIRDIQNTSPQVRVGGEIEFQPSEVEDKTDAMIVGPAERGPFFVPTEIRTRQEFETVFGGPKTYSSYSAIETLRQTDRIKFTRIGDADGWNPTAITVFSEGATDFPHFEAEGSNPLAVLIFSDRYQREESAVPEKTQILQASADREKIASDFTIQTFDEEDCLVDEFRLSLNPFSGRYIERVLPPKIRVYQNFRESQFSTIRETAEDVPVSLTVYGPDNLENPLQFPTFNAPRTPWILSQKTVGERHKLFRIWVRSDGESENRRFKVSITDIGRGTSESGWPLFTVKLRDFDDTDLNQEIIEEFDDLSLNPSDERFIGKAIGTEYKTFNEETGRIDQFGSFEQNSLNIRVELSEELSRSTSETLPYGFASYKQTFTASSQVPVYRTEPSFSGELFDYLTNNQKGTTRRQSNLGGDLHFGIDFQFQQNENFFRGVPEGAEKVDSGFQLDAPPPSSPEADPVLPIESSTARERKFTVGFQGGSDGQSIYKQKFQGDRIQTSNTFGIDFQGRQSDGQKAYRRAFDVLSEPSGGFNFSLLTTPELDVENHTETVLNADQLVKERGDALYVFDAFEKGTSPQEALDQPVLLDSSTSATYYNWIKPTESNFDFVPPSAVVPQTYAQNDRRNDPWIAAAGPEQGSVPNVEGVEIRIGRQTTDALYGKSVNAIRFSDSRGINFVGNRTTLSNLDSSLSSVNIRRLIAFIVTRSRRISENYLFEQVGPETGQNLKSDLIDLLSTVQSRKGLRRYRTRVTVPQERQSPNRRPNTLEASVSIIPRAASEYITIDFTISEEGINVIT